MTGSIRRRPVGNVCPRCPICSVRHRADRPCIVPERTTDIAAGAGNGRYHPAHFLKKYGG